jgi:hypothetical protein
MAKYVLIVSFQPGVAETPRALEIAAKLSAVPGPGGVPTEQPIHVRQIMEDAPTDAAGMESSLLQAG